MTAKEFQIEKTKIKSPVPKGGLHQIESTNEANSDTFSQIRLDTAYENSVMEKRSVSFTPTVDDRNDPRRKDKSPLSKKKLNTSQYSAISGVFSLKKSLRDEKEEQERELSLLTTTRTEFVRVPVKHTSKFIDNHKGKNKIHEPNDENPVSTACNLNDAWKYSKNPYFDKRIKKTKHAEHFDKVSLF